MLTFLQIRDYAIIDALDLDVCEGFTCITGETGAGKSILVGALGLLSGDRADTGAIRTGAERAELSAGFELPEDSPALAWLRDNDLDEDGSCLLRRTMASNGRSRAWINGIAVTLQQLAELGDLLIEIHGQNEHLRLARAEEQFRLLDSSGAHAQELQDVHRCCETWRTLAAEREALLAEKPLDAGEQDLLQYQVRELENEALSADEFSQLESEHRMLARGGELLEELEAAARTLDAEPSGAARTLHRAADRLGPHGALDRDIAAAAALLREAAINCDEALGSVQAALGRLDLSPDRLSDLERKLGVQHDLARKHRVQPEQLHQVLEDLRGRLERAGSLEQRLDSLERDLELALDAYREAAAALHARRTERAAELSEAVTALLPQLGLVGGCFSVQVRLDGELQAAPRGSDRVELLVSANAGIPPGPLRKVASGGELSRISLAIKVASRTAAAATQVFDEVDAGIGGETAHAVGALIRSLAAGGQALCVTHLAQVAVFADQQVRVAKSKEDPGTRVRTDVLEDQERVDEIARMLGGRLSAQSRAHASELLAATSRQH
jgi:DNA repair protein RecN (Recombination protein N)